uniref:Uncharacterized protein n=1 Tax=Pristionchus pacificus TaxID=54126 RepID=A0A2A6BYG8_PRIPA|eukprot:PDM70867.1 hypothetical protein PRIPAC_44483 [Pristionchus pacificus]
MIPGPVGTAPLDLWADWMRADVPVGRHWRPMASVPYPLGWRTDSNNQRSRSIRSSLVFSCLCLHRPSSFPPPFLLHTDPSPPPRVDCLSKDRSSIVVDHG